MKIKYIVLKHDDVNKYLDWDDIKRLALLTNKIDLLREHEGRKQNEYLVINKDEPYIGDIIETLKKNGHWG